jgi:hypothetical protein
MDRRDPCGPDASRLGLTVDRSVRTVTLGCATGAAAWSYGGSDVLGRRSVASAPLKIDKEAETTVSREPEDPDMTGDSAFGATQDGAAPASARTSQTPAARSWPRRLVHSLVLLDSWSPASYRLSSLPAARSYVRAEWTRSGDLTGPQAAALLALDETTPWQV